MVHRKRFVDVVRTHVILLLFFFARNTLATGIDSLLIDNLKSYFQDATGYKPEKKLFTICSESNRPWVVLYISLGTKVASPPDLIGMINSFGNDEEYARRYAIRYNILGYHTFIYETYGTMLAEVSDRFVSYPPEAQSFIALHEFTHYYVRHRLSEMKDRSRPIPYNYEEALGDIVGNYGAIEFAKTSGGVHLREVRNQKSRTERIYRMVNRTTKRIDTDSSKVGKLNRKCQKRIEHVLVEKDLFQKDRFDYPVNNAFLLKNRYYAEKYFLLRKLLRKTGSVKNLMREIDSCPTDPAGIDRYIKNYAANSSKN